jgi:putative Holliday junction resolvase
VRTLALDVGDKTVGVAVSDELGITARGLFTLERVSDKKTVGAIFDLIDEYDCEEVVVGLPVNLSGSDSVQTQKVRDFAVRLENKLRSNAKSKVAVVFHDERFTTKIAERVLVEAKLNREKRRAIIDKQAAVVILQSYLEQSRSRKKHDE